MCKVYRDHFPWPQSSFFDYFVRFTGNNADLGCKNEQTMRSKSVTSRAQTIAVKRRTYDVPIAKNQCRWPIPRLHLTRVVFTPCTLLRVQFGIVFPGGRNKHLHTVQQIATGIREKFDHVVKLRRITPAWLDNRQ